MDGERLSRPSVPELDAILGVSFRVLDEGFVRVVDYMGNDAAVVQAARVSYGAGTKQLREDRGLIRYLMRNAHTTPFEMCELKLHIRAPMDCWRQWIRHRTASVNEYSTRYSVAIDAAQKTAPTDWRGQGSVNRQGSAGSIPIEAGEALSKREASFLSEARSVYEERLAAGVAREQARKDLPLSTYTEAYWKVDLHNLFHFLHLRMDAHAQQEIRFYAETIGTAIVSRWCPISWEAFVDLRQGAVTFSAAETKIVSLLTGNRIEEATSAAIHAGLIDEDPPKRRTRERAQFEAKLTSIGLESPWRDDDADAP
jgi:thymidylate synthase (FAD)